MSSEAVRRRLSDRLVNLGEITLVEGFVGETPEVKAALRSFRLRAAIRKVPVLGPAIRGIYRALRRVAGR